MPMNTLQNNKQIKFIYLRKNIFFPSYFLLFWT